VRVHEAEGNGRGAAGKGERVKEGGGWKRRVRVFKFRMFFFIPLF
jgi:hypothetical protein